MNVNKKYVYLYEEGSREMVELLGGKGAGLAEMHNLGLNVPEGFTIITEACRDFLKNGKFPEGMLEQVMETLHKVEERSGKKFGDASNPLLVSVRSGAPVSMPGMMDTILNVGLNDNTVRGLASKTSDERFALDSYRRLIQMFGSVVMALPKAEFEHTLEEIKRKNSLRYDSELNPERLRELIGLYHGVYSKHGKVFPQDPVKQLTLSMEAVFRSWNSDRAVAYREISNIPDTMGTAISVVSMVFGNMGNDSATGVAFTRDPNTGDRRLFAEYLTNAQGEDVVSGSRTPRSIADMEKELPDAYRTLVDYVGKLEDHYRDMMDIEFTVEKGRLYLLQTRVGKRTARASVKIAVDLVNEGKIDRREAVLRITPETLNITLHPQLRKDPKNVPAGKGLAASPGAAIVEIVFSSDRAVELSKQKRKLILVRPETTADDVRGMSCSEGFLTQKGGMTSHAAVVARAMGKPAVVGAEMIRVDASAKTMKVNGLEFREGDIITVDGTAGEFYKGKLELESSSNSPEVSKLLEFADDFRRLGVRANANTPEEAVMARLHGAEGIGLARTERMFLGNDRIQIMRNMIMSRSQKERKEHLDRLLPMQVSDFTEFFRSMAGFPVIIRLLDPPLHEFLPEKEQIMTEIFDIRLRTADRPEGKDRERLAELTDLLKTVRILAEFNPMLGFRGCRVGIVFPEIYDMQTKAILQAALKVVEEGKDILPEIMIPLVGHSNELKKIRSRLEDVARQFLGSRKLKYKFGTMVEIPRACVTADEIAKHADFFSFGTNDLTQMTFGYSRDDAEGKFLANYVEEGILPEDPFSSVDQEGVGELMKMAVSRGRSTNRDLEIGICGEQGGDPKTIEFCHRIGLDYVSASPFRIPIARLAAARAALENAPLARSK